MWRPLLTAAWAFIVAPVHADGQADRPLPEASAFVQGLAEKQRQREEALNDYTYDMRHVEEKLDRTGTVKETKTGDYEVFYVKGKPVHRQVAEDDVPLSPDRMAKEDADVQKKIKKIGERQATRKDDGPRLSEVLARFEFRSVAREVIDGRPAIVMDVAPRPGKRDLEADHVLRSLTGRIWVDELEREVVRAHMRNLSKIKFALGLAASVSQLDFTLDFRKIDEGVWLPARVQGQVAGRIALFKAIRVRTTLTYGRYRRFRVDAEERVRSSEPQR